MKLRNSKTKLFCETSFKNEASKLKNQTFLRDFLQKWSFSARRPPKMKLRNSKTKLFCETSFKNDTSGTNRVTGDHKGDAPFLCQVWDSKHTWSLVTLSFLLQTVETVNRVTSDQCPLRTVVDSLCCIRGFSRIVSETYNVLFPHAL